MNLVQMSRRGERRVAVVDGASLQLLNRHRTTYDLASEAVAAGTSLVDFIQRAETNEAISYDEVYEGTSEWQLLPSFDHPNDPAHCLVSGTGLTHKASAENRAAMHKQTGTEITDSIRMYRMGLEGGNPAAGTIGVQPEWFFKGNGFLLRAHGEPLEIPSYGEDGGEEPEIAGAYLISPEGEPLRVGLTIGNEFSDHKMEKRNYLYLAPSKLRNCALGPELAVGDVRFEDVAGTVSILRNGQPFWNKPIWTGQKNMSHSVANLEHHHFKYEAHRRPGDVHIHFFGADAFSFGEDIILEENDVMEISFPSFGRALRNPLVFSKRSDLLHKARAL